jgi:hypothetical protein
MKLCFIKYVESPWVNYTPTILVPLAFAQFQVGTLLFLYYLIKLGCELFDLRSSAQTRHCRVFNQTRSWFERTYTSYADGFSVSHASSVVTFVSSTVLISGK